MSEKTLIPKNSAHARKILRYLIDNVNLDGSLEIKLLNEISEEEFINSFKGITLQLGILRKAIVKLKESNKFDLEDFTLEYFKAEKEKRNTAYDENNWTFYIPFLADVDKSVKLPFSINLLGFRFEFTSKVSYKNRLSKNLPYHLFSYRDDIITSLQNSKSVFIKVRSDGLDERSAWLKITLPYEVLRGIMEFTINYFATIISSDQQQRAKIHHPNWIIALSKDRQIDGLRFITDNQRQPFLFKFTNQTQSAVKNNSKIIAKKLDKSSSLELLVTALRQYADALSSKYNFNQLLGLWQVAETLTLSKEYYGKSSEVASRLTWFGNNLGLIGSGYKYTLLAISEKRNKIVHEGISDITDDDVNFLKIAVDRTLFWFFQNLSALKTIRHVSEFYRLKDINNTDKDAINDIIKFISSKYRNNTVL